MKYIVDGVETVDDSQVNKRQQMHIYFFLSQVTITLLVLNGIALLKL